MTPALPSLSASQPPKRRAMEPINAPTKLSPAGQVATNGWLARNSGNVFLMTRGKAKEKPMNDLKVPM